MVKSNTQSNFAGNVLKIITGSAFAQILALITTPIIARLFTPDAFGLAALFVSISGMISVVACLRYELSIMLPKSDEEAVNLLGVSFFFVTIVTLISAFAIFFAEGLFVDFFKSQEFRKLGWLIPLSVFLSGITLALNYWNTRTAHFGRLSIAKVLSSVVAQLSKIGFGFAGYINGIMLIYSVILGQIISIFFLGSNIWRHDLKLFKNSIRLKKMLKGLKRYKKFPIYNSFSAFLNTSSQQLPVMLLAFYFSPKVLGFYSLGKSVLSMPIGLIGEAVSQVFFQKASELNHLTGDLALLVEDVLTRLISIGIFPFALLAIIGEDVFKIIFGTIWSEAGLYMQILSFWIFFQFITSPISTLFSVFEKQNYGMYFNGILFGTRAASLIVGGIIGNVRLTLTLVSVTGSLCYIYICMWLLSKAGVSYINLIYRIAKNGMYIVPILMVIIIAKWSFEINGLELICLSIFCASLYYFVIILTDRELKRVILNIWPLGILK
ncbi:oligosaccharide flippase family protein [Desulfosarcina widdelii]|nr:oligosaccharide flippase family protein [Desulfosarcina widdelii]